MTVEELVKELEEIRDILGDSPEINARERRWIGIESIETYFDNCDAAAMAIDKAYGMLDDLATYELNGE